MGNTPNIRFKGFTNDWEQRKLSDEFKNFIVPMRDKPKEFGGNIPWTRIEDIEGKYLNDSLSGQYVTEETINQMNLKIIPKDSLIVSSSATFGVVAVITQDLITNQTFIGLVPNDKETLDYWYAFFHSDEARKYMRLQSAGSTIFYIARESFENMPIKVPTKDEMIKIGTYFDNLDNLITLHQRKCDETKELKKFMLQKMFPKNGEKKPEIRFEGFTDDWEQRKVSDLGNIVTGSTPPTKDKSNYDGEFLFVSPADIQGNRYVTNTITTLTEQGFNKGRILKEKSTLFVSIGSTIGKVAQTLEKSTTNQQINAIEPYCEFDEDFVFTLMEKTSGQIKSLAATQAVPIVNKTSFGEVEINVPLDIAEQIKIGVYFRNLDNLITLHQRKCDEIKEIKKFMLQNMFPQKG
ncbi:MAG: restriction endonuclease subunit S [Lachnobacterium sp.]|nr:restriction endonuclease subunit S [Lachnobacterium sp.]